MKNFIKNLLIGFATCSAISLAFMQVAILATLMGQGKEIHLLATLVTLSVIASVWYAIINN